MNRVFSTRQLAALCAVNESTIKRWSDSGKLTCIKTPGGHRKFKMQDVVTFLHEHGLDSGPLGAALTMDGAGLHAELDTWIGNHESGPIAETYVQAALQGGHHAVGLLLLRVMSAGYSSIQICDEIVGPALTSVGDLWAEGKLSILDEHLVSSATLEGLTLLAEAMPRAEPLPMKALCCTGEADPHTIGARMSGLALESIGWNVSSLTSSAPSEEVVRFIERDGPQLVCISLIYHPEDLTLRPGYTRIWEAARQVGTRVALGGRGVSPTSDLPCDFRGENLAQLAHWARTLAQAGRPTPTPTSHRVGTN